MASTTRVALSASLLFAHARHYDVLCDDAFISLRYARNLAEGRGLVYNVGERVEGFTNFAWVLLEAALFRLGAGPRLAIDVLGFATALAGALLIERGADRLGLRPLGRAVAHATVVSSVSFAVWLLAGLEASAYGVLLLATFLCATEATRAEGASDTASRTAGLVAALAMLLRPETPLAVASAALAALLVGHGRALRPLVVSGFTFAAVVAPLLAWRRHYFGDWLPNTFYLKTTGEADELLAQGQRYVLYAAQHHRIALAFGVAGVVALVRDLRTRAFALGSLVFFLVYGAYVTRVGGDFLPATRFFAPLVPLLALFVGAAVDEVLRLVPDTLPTFARRAVRGAAVGVAAALIIAPQHAWAETVGVEHEEEEKALHIEPLSWTRLYGIRWSALGRWIAAHAREGDGMAMGAAGAAPYFAGATVWNLDLLGLCDRFVAREGTVVGSRPGHQRRSPLEYTLGRRPVFLFEGDWMSEASPTLERDAIWEARGYEWAAARVDASRFDAPATFWWVFLLRRDRASELRGSPDLRLATDALN